MKRQAISISLADLEKLKKQLKKEVLDIKKLEIMEKDKLTNVKFQLNIVNYPTVTSNNRTMYCSDTWEFEMLKPKEENKK